MFILIILISNACIIIIVFDCFNVNMFILIILISNACIIISLLYIFNYINIYIYYNNIWRIIIQYNIKYDHLL